MGLIDADALAACLRDELEHDCNRYSYWTDKLERDSKYEFAIERIESAPTIEARPVVRGEWEAVKKHLVAVNPYQHTCGVCGESYFDHNKFNHPFCPNCGADMRGEEDAKTECNACEAASAV